MGEWPYQVIVVCHDVVLHSSGRFQLFPALLTREGILQRTYSFSFWNSVEPMWVQHGRLLLWGWCRLTTRQFSICFFSPSTVFLLTLLHLGHVTRPLPRIISCHLSSWLPVPHRKWSVFYYCTSRIRNNTYLYNVITQVLRNIVNTTWLLK